MPSKVSRFFFEVQQVEHCDVAMGFRFACGHRRADAAQPWLTDRSHQGQSAPAGIETERNPNRNAESRPKMLDPINRNIELVREEMAQPYIEARPEQGAHGVEGKESLEWHSFGAGKWRHDNAQSGKKPGHTKRRETVAADLLIAECAYKSGQSNEAWPHLNPEMAARIAKEAGAKKLALIHFDARTHPTLGDRTDSENAAKKIFTETFATIDDMKIRI